MKNVFVTLKELFRKDNKKTWLPMIGSFAGLFLAPALDLVIKDNPYCLLGSFIAGCVCGVVYLCLAFRYIRQTHSIYAVLRSDETLWRTCAYLANRQGKKATNNYKLQTLNINYILEKPAINSSGIRTYPFSVEYAVNGCATTTMSEIYYHTVGATHKDQHVKVEYAFGDGEYCLVDSSNYSGSKKSITFYKLYAETCYHKNEAFNYKIRISYDAERGIPVVGEQRVLFDPMNLSQNCKGVKASIKLSCPHSVETDFDKLHIRQYADGLNIIPNEGQLSLRKRDYANNQIVYKCNIDVEFNRLYLLMFVAKEQQ